MKHNLKVTVILLAMFLVTQFIGLYVVNSYSTQRVDKGDDPRSEKPGKNDYPEYPFDE